MMQIRDELSGLFAGMARQPGAGGFYLECWNGEKHVVERVDSKRSLTVPNLLVGIIGGFQPDKLARAFAGDEDGMYAQVLVRLARDAGIRAAQRRYRVKSIRYFRVC